MTSFLVIFIFCKSFHNFSAQICLTNAYGECDIDDDNNDINDNDDDNYDDDNDNVNNNDNVYDKDNSDNDDEYRSKMILVVPPRYFGPLSSAVTSPYVDVKKRKRP